MRTKKKLSVFAGLMGDRKNFVIVFSRAPLMYLSVMGFSKGIHFYSRLPINVSCLFKVPIKTFAGVRFDQSLPS